MASDSEDEHTEQTEQAEQRIKWPAGEGESKIRLRDIGRSDRWFWKPTLEEYLKQRVFDKAGNDRELFGNEMLAMALNEIAVFRGHGFFYYLIPRDGWKRIGAGSGRTPGMPGGRYPAIAFMSFVWSEDERAGYFAATHRSRYLMCGSLTNPPPDITPLYAVQFADYAKSPVFATESDSLLILATSSDLYLVSCHTWRQTMGKPARRLGGNDAKMRIATTPWLWQQPEPGKEAEHRANMDRVLPFKMGSLEQLYETICATCRPGALPATLSGRELWQVVPRPTSPERGVALGTPLQDAGDDEPVASQSRPDSRRGGRKARGRAARGSPLAALPLHAPDDEPSTRQVEPGQR